MTVCVIHLGSLRDPFHLFIILLLWPFDSRSLTHFVLTSVSLRFYMYPSSQKHSKQCRWELWIMASREYTERYQGNDIVVDFEFAQRFSWRLLEFLSRLVSVDHVAAESEMFAPTVCAAEPWCSVACVNSFTYCRTCPPFV